MLDYDFQASTLIAGTTGGSLSKRLIEAIRLAFVSTISIKKLSVGQSSCLDFDFQQNGEKSKGQEAELLLVIPC